MGLSGKVGVRIPKFSVPDRETVRVGVFRAKCDAVQLLAGFDMVKGDHLVGCVRAPDAVAIPCQAVQSFQFDGELMNNPVVLTVYEVKRFRTELRDPDVPVVPLDAVDASSVGCPESVDRVTRLEVQLV